jgi:hypothetical protein
MVRYPETWRDMYSSEYLWDGEIFPVRSHDMVKYHWFSEISLGASVKIVRYPRVYPDMVRYFQVYPRTWWDIRWYIHWYNDICLVRGRTCWDIPSHLRYHRATKTSPGILRYLPAKPNILRHTQASSDVLRHSRRHLKSSLSKIYPGSSGPVHWGLPFAEICERRFRERYQRIAAHQQTGPKYVHRGELMEEDMVIVVCTLLPDGLFLGRIPRNRPWKHPGTSKFCGLENGHENGA